MRGDYTSIRTTSALAYNEVRRAYPALQYRSQAGSTGSSQEVRAAHSVLATLSTSPHVAQHLHRSLRTVQEALSGHLPLENWGLDSGRLGSGREAGCVGGKEGLLELRENLYELLGAYEEEDAERHDDGLGTDEEAAEDRDELDWE